MKDIWNYILKLKEESFYISKTKSWNSMIKDVFHQIPFFTCTNHFISEKNQKDISKYLYCEDTKTPPNPGAYGDTPSIWKEKHFLIKGAMSILYQDKRAQIKNKHGKS